MSSVCSLAPLAGRGWGEGWSSKAMMGVAALDPSYESGGINSDYNRYSGCSLSSRRITATITGSFRSGLSVTWRTVCSATSCGISL